MRNQALMIVALAVVGCKGKPTEERVYAIGEPTTEGTADLQLEYCTHPRKAATAEGRRLCRDVIGFAIMDLRRPKIEAGELPYSYTACWQSLEALLFAAHDDPRWTDRRDWVVARCCRSPYGPEKECAAIGSPRPSVAGDTAR